MCTRSRAPPPRPGSNPPGRRMEEEGGEGGAALPRFLHTAESSPTGIWFQPTGASWKPWQPSDCLPATARCFWTKAVSGIQPDGFAFSRRYERLFPFAALCRRQRDCNHFESFIYLFVWGLEFILVPFAASSATFHPPPALHLGSSCAY